MRQLRLTAFCSVLSSRRSGPNTFHPLRDFPPSGAVHRLSAAAAFRSFAPSRACVAPGSSERLDQPIQPFSFFKKFANNPVEIHVQLAPGGVELRDIGLDSYPLL